MPLFHADALIDHYNAKIYSLTPCIFSLKKIQSHKQYTRQHGSRVRDTQEFFGEVCDGLTDIAQSMMADSHTPLSNFRHYVTKYSPNLLTQIIGWENVDQPTDAQPVAMSRKYFVEHDLMSGIPLP